MSQGELIDKAILESILRVRLKHRPVYWPKTLADITPTVLADCGGSDVVDKAPVQKLQKKNKQRDGR